jgi:hypothetical protein
VKIELRPSTLRLEDVLSCAIYSTSFLSEGSRLS